MVRFLLSTLLAMSPLGFTTPQTTSHRTELIRHVAAIRATPADATEDRYGVGLLTGTANGRLHVAFDARLLLEGDETVAVQLGGRRDWLPGDALTLDESGRLASVHLPERYLLSASDTLFRDLWIHAKSPRPAPARAVSRHADGTIHSTSLLPAEVGYAIDEQAIELPLPGAIVTSTDWALLGIAHSRGDIVELVDLDALQEFAKARSQPFALHRLEAEEVLDGCLREGRPLWFRLVRRVSDLDKWEALDLRADVMGRNARTFDAQALSQTNETKPVVIRVDPTGMRVQFGNYNYWADCLNTEFELVRVPVDLPGHLVFRGTHGQVSVEAVVPTGNTRLLGPLAADESGPARRDWQFHLTELTKRLLPPHFTVDGELPLAPVHLQSKQAGSGFSIATTEVASHGAILRGRVSLSDHYWLESAASRILHDSCFLRITAHRDGVADSSTRVAIPGPLRQATFAVDVPAGTTKLDIESCIPDVSWTHTLTVLSGCTLTPVDNQ